ncbi:MAG: DUF962 domain-containing protein [Deltaproteobacteria bacterium]|nr:DUF962 domain-containing protein [Deltaproteobacteria bacterium]
MNELNKIETFSDFWPVYLRAHSSAASRAWHVAGLVGGALVAGALLATGMVFFLAAALVPVHLGAYLGHRLSLRTADLRLVEERPGWAAVAELKMARLMLTGHLEPELRRAAGRRAGPGPSRPAWSMS